MKKINWKELFKDYLNLNLKWWTIIFLFLPSIFFILFAILLIMIFFTPVYNPKTDLLFWKTIADFSSSLTIFGIGILLGEKALKSWGKLTERKIKKEARGEVSFKKSIKTKFKNLKWVKISSANKNELLVTCITWYIFYIIFWSTEIDLSSEKLIFLTLSLFGMCLTYIALKTLSEMYYTRPQEIIPLEEAMMRGHAISQLLYIGFTSSEKSLIQDWEPIASYISLPIEATILRNFQESIKKYEREPKNKTSGLHKTYKIDSENLKNIENLFYEVFKNNNKISKNEKIKLEKPCRYKFEDEDKSVLLGISTSVLSDALILELYSEESEKRYPILIELLPSEIDLQKKSVDHILRISFSMTDSKEFEKEFKEIKWAKYSDFFDNEPLILAGRNPRILYLILNVFYACFEEISFFKEVYLEEAKCKHGGEISKIEHKYYDFINTPLIKQVWSYQNEMDMLFYDKEQYFISYGRFKDELLWYKDLKEYQIKLNTPININSCLGKTKRGKQCKNKPLPNQPTCQIHKNQFPER